MVSGGKERGREGGREGGGEKGKTLGDSTVVLVEEDGMGLCAYWAIRRIKSRGGERRE